MFPPILFFSTRLLLLVPMRPRPKLLLLGSEGEDLEAAEPLPSNVFNRTRLRWLLDIQVPPQENPFEPPAFLAKMFPSILLSSRPAVWSPLKQFSEKVTFFSATFFTSVPGAKLPKSTPQRRK